MIQQMVEIIQWGTLPPADDDRPGLFVGVVAGGRQGTEQGGHGQFGLGPTVVGGRVDDRRSPVGITQQVARPQVAMEQGRGLGRHQVDEALGQALDAATVVSRQEAAAGRQPGLETQALGGEEGVAVVAASVGLGGRADVVVVVEAEGRSVVVVERGQGPAEARPVSGGRGSWAQVLQQQAGGALGQGHGHPRAVAHGQGGEAGRLGCEQPGRWLGIGLHHHARGAGARQVPAFDAVDAPPAEALTPGHAQAPLGQPGIEHCGWLEGHGRSTTAGAGLSTGESVEHRDMDNPMATARQLQSGGDAPLTDHERSAAQALGLAAASPDPAVSGPALAACFNGLVEPLNDRLDAAGRARYARVFPALVWPVLAADDDLRSALAACGVADEERLVARYQRIRAGAPTVTAPNRVVVLSRVTIGADILLTSVLIQRLRRAWPAAELLLVGDAKLEPLFSRLAGVRLVPLAYRRRGHLGQRLRAWLELRAVVAGLAPDLVVGPDSRLDQLGLLPVVDEGRYTLWENLLPPGPGESLARILDRWVAGWLGQEATPAVDPALGLDHPRLALAATLAGALGQEPILAVKLDHGGNPAKALPREGAALLLRTARRLGWRLLLDRGFGDRELVESDRLLAAAGLEAVDLDEGSRIGRDPTTLAAGALADAAVVRFHGSIAGWAAACSICGHALSYDSVGHHLAAALGVPLTTVFAGHGDPRFPVAWQAVGPGPRRQFLVEAGERADPACWQRLAASLPKP